MADDLVRIRLAHEGGTVARRRRPAGKARDRQIEAAPEEMDGTALADERAATAGQHAIDLRRIRQNRFAYTRIVAAVRRVLVEPDRRFGISTGIGQIFTGSPISASVAMTSR